MKNFVCIITGPCAAGKSTVGKLLAKDAKFEHAIFIEADSIRRMVWSGYVPPFPETPDSRKQLVLAAQATSGVAKLYYEAGFSVFIEEVLEPFLTPVYLEELSECNMKVVCLLLDQKELFKRDASRSKNEQIGKHCFELLKSFRTWAQSEPWFVIDSTNQTPKETTQAIVDFFE